MAVILQMTYMKKLGLPNYSSHSCAASLTVEIADVSVAAQESTKLYKGLWTFETEPPLTTSGSSLRDSNPGAPFSQR